MNEKYAKGYFALSHLLVSNFFQHFILKLSKSACFSKITKKPEYILNVLHMMSIFDIKKLEYES